MQTISVHAWMRAADGMIMRDGLMENTSRNTGTILSHRRGTGLDAARNQETVFKLGVTAPAAEL